MLHLKVLSEFHEKCKVGLERPLKKHLLTSNISLMEKSRGARIGQHRSLSCHFLQITGRYILAVVSAIEEMNLAGVMQF